MSCLPGVFCEAPHARYQKILLNVQKISTHGQWWTTTASVCIICWLTEQTPMCLCLRAERLHRIRFPSLWRMASCLDIGSCHASNWITVLQFQFFSIRVQSLVQLWVVKKRSNSTTKAVVVESWMHPNPPCSGGFHGNISEVTSGVAKTVTGTLLSAIVPHKFLIDQPKPNQASKSCGNSNIVLPSDLTNKLEEVSLSI